MKNGDAAIARAREALASAGGGIPGPDALPALREACRVGRAQRNALIAAAHAEGLSNAEIARVHDLSPPWIREIIRRGAPKA